MRDAVSLTADPDSQILQSDPKSLIMKYQDMIAAISGKYVASGMFSAEYLSDVRQTINAELLERIPSMQAHYNGTALVRTYVSAVIRNICLRLHEKGLYGNRPDNPKKETLLAPVEMVDRYSVAQAKRLFGGVFTQYGGQIPKLRICLKLRFRIPLTKKDILQMSPRCGPSEFSRTMKQFGGDYRDMQEREIFEWFTPIFNQAERKENSPDALRKWSASKICEILELLNAGMPGATFDEESLSILVDDYFSPFLLKG